MAGLLRAGGRQRTDSTHVLAAVRTLNRMEFAGETLRAALEALAAAAPGWLSTLTGAGWADRYGARTGSCRFPKGKDARGRWLGQVGRDGFTLLDAVTAPGAPEWLGQVPAVSTLRRAWDQQYHRDGQEARWREGKDLPPGEQRFASPYDPDARYGVKRRAGWTGYKVHLTEACEPDLPHLILNVENTAATVDDAEMTAAIRQRLAGRRLAPAEHAAGAGYGAGYVSAGRDDHGITLPGPVGADTTQSQRDDRKEPLLPQDAFTIDWDARKVTCPQGATSISWSDQRKPSGTPVAWVHFALGLRCVPAAGQVHQGGERQVRTQPHPADPRAARGPRPAARRQQTPEWRARYNIRAGVEGTISQAVRATRMRRTPYHGQPKTHLASILNATAINLIRTHAWLNGTPLGTTRISHLARLDLAA